MNTHVDFLFGNFEINATPNVIFISKGENIKVFLDLFCVDF